MRFIVLNLFQSPNRVLNEYVRLSSGYSPTDHETEV